MTPKSRQRGFSVRGDLLHKMRLARNWSQEEAASRVGVSEKLIRKAENGGRIDASSIQALTALYSSPGQPLCPADLIVCGGEHSGEANDPNQWKSVVVQWLEGIWNDRSLETIERLAAPRMVFHCELGRLTTTAEVRARAERIWASFDDFRLTIDRVVETGNRAVCRWWLNMKQTGPWLDDTFTGRRIETYGTTTAHVEAGLIAECWEFWSPQAAYHELSRASLAPDQPTQDRRCDYGR